ncbi:hypothetical protein Mx9_p78 [Myxococcus phage Mx9]|nr:hypothetical protein Mx9_p78 [Myxococcus phage Mx9]
MAVERREDMNGRLFVVDIEEAGALHTFSLTFAGARRLHAWLGDALKGGRHGDEVES